MGVAALSSPSILAETFMKIDPMAGCPLGTPGKRRVKSGEIRRPKKPITPARSPIFISPSQSERMPVRPSEISKPVAAELNEADMTDDHTDTSPITSDWKRAKTKVTRKNAIQI